jgi:purine-binding chemotaxis protein CheW
MNKEELAVMNSYLSFRLGDEIFAIHVAKVHKILEMSSITELPHSPDYMKGVINLRGNVLPVIDARVKFGLEPIAKTKSTSILVVEVEISGESVLLGMMVDAVQAVLKIETEDMLPAPTLGDKYKSDFITNMTKVKDKFYIILDLDAVFSSDDHIQIKEITDVKEMAIKKESKKSQNKELAQKT